MEGFPGRGVSQRPACRTSKPSVKIKLATKPISALLLDPLSQLRIAQRLGLRLFPCSRILLLRDLGPTTPRAYLVHRHLVRSFLLSSERAAVVSPRRLFVLGSASKHTPCRGTYKQTCAVGLIAWLSRACTRRDD